MTARPLNDKMADMATEVERFASFDLPTRRFIAYAIALVPELRALINQSELHAGNAALPFEIPLAEAKSRTAAYVLLPEIRACSGYGAEGQRQRRMAFGALLEIAFVDVRARRLTSLAAMLFCYERIAGPYWRELIPLCWKEAALQRRRRGQSRVMPPLDARLRDDEAVPDRLREEPAPWFFPSLADADNLVGNAPLLDGL